MGKGLIWCGLISFVSAAFGLDRVGMMAAMEGEVKAANGAYAERELQQYSDIYLGDSLVTSDGAKAEIQFTDGTLLLLIPHSHLSIDRYAASRLWGKNEFVAKLHEGGARLSTGFISKKSPKNFRFETTKATIEVRGTVFETRLMDGDLFVGSSLGKIGVKNEAGSLEIGKGERSQFAVVPSVDSIPQPLNERPALLGLSNFVPPNGGIAFEATPTMRPAAGAATGVAAASAHGWMPAITAAVVFAIVVTAAVVSATETPQNLSH